MEELNMARWAVTGKKENENGNETLPIMRKNIVPRRVFSEPMVG
jgi:hypothetical protein